MTSTPSWLANQPAMPSIHSWASPINLLLFQFPATMLRITFVLSIWGPKSGTPQRQPHGQCTNSHGRIPSPSRLAESALGIRGTAATSSATRARPGPWKTRPRLDAHRRGQKHVFSAASPRIVAVCALWSPWSHSCRTNATNSGHAAFGPRHGWVATGTACWTTSGLAKPNFCTWPQSGFIPVPRPPWILGCPDSRCGRGALHFPMGT